MRLHTFVFPLLAIVLGLLAGTNGKELKPDNFHQVDEQLFRSAQPAHRDCEFLKQIGIRTVINLRNGQNDVHELKGSGIKEIRLQLRTKKVTMGDVITTLKLIKNAEKPVLIHCRRGSDRTGCMVAAYRIAFNGWSKEKAIKEFTDEQYGYLQSLFPNLLELINGCEESELIESVR